MSKDFLSSPSMNEIGFWFEPIFTHTSQIQQNTIRTISDVITFPTKKATFWWWDINISLLPSDNTGRYIDYKWVRIPIHIDNTAKWVHNITLVQDRIRFRIVEHILSITGGLNIDYNIAINWANNMPTEHNCIEDYLIKIQDNIVDTWKEIEYFTVNEPVKINGPKGSYIILIPAKDGEKKMTIDLSLSHATKSIGNQRIVIDIDDEMFSRLASARTNAYWLRQKLLFHSNKIPFLNNFFSISTNNVFMFNKEKNINPKDDIKMREKNIYLELVFHEVLDKLGARWLWMQDGKRFCGTIITYKASHDLDLDLIQAIEQWHISTTSI